MGKENYSFIRVLGKGSFGAAFLVIRKSDGVELAAKEVRLEGLSREDREAAGREIQVISRLNHPNIVRYVEHFEQEGTLFIIMEYANGGDLYSSIQSRRGRLFTEEEVLHYFSQLCLALSYLHEQNVLHRDLKSQNVFLTKDNVVKLGDFGISAALRSAQELRETVCGTPYYFSPEMCLNQPYNSKSDVWALGCILYELATLRNAFDANNMYSLVRKILRGVYPPISPSFSLPLSNLISRMLQLHPERRPPVRDILRVPFIQRALRHLQEDLHSSLEGKSPTRHLPPPGCPPTSDPPVLLITPEFSPALGSPSAAVTASSHAKNDVMRGYYEGRREALLNKQRCYREELGLGSSLSLSTRPPLPSLTAVRGMADTRGEEGEVLEGKKRRAMGPLPLQPAPARMGRGRGGGGGGYRTGKGEQEQRKTKVESETAARATAFWQMRQEAAENKRRLRLALQEPVAHKEEVVREGGGEEKDLFSAFPVMASHVEKEGPSRDPPPVLEMPKRVEGKWRQLEAEDARGKDDLQIKTNPPPSDYRELAGAIAHTLEHLDQEEHHVTMNPTKEENTMASGEVVKTTKKDIARLPPGDAPSLSRRNGADETKRRGEGRYPVDTSVGKEPLLPATGKSRKEEEERRPVKEEGCAGSGGGWPTADPSVSSASPTHTSAPPERGGVYNASGATPECDPEWLLRMAEKLASPVCPPTTAHGDSLMYRIEKLRLYLEKEMGEDHLLAVYKAMSNITENEEEEDMMLKGANGFSAAQLQQFIPLITQLIVCEDMLNES